MNQYTRIHVFFDNSNIWGGAQEMRKLNEPEAHWAAFRLYYRNLFRLIEQDRAVDESVLAGSVPPSCEQLWEYAEAVLPARRRPKSLREPLVIINGQVNGQANGKANGKAKPSATSANIASRPSIACGLPHQSSSALGSRRQMARTNAVRWLARIPYSASSIVEEK